MLKPPQVAREGTKKTVFTNFHDLCKVWLVVVVVLVCVCVCVVVVCVGGGCLGFCAFGRL